MDAARLKQIEEIYHAALEIPTAGREAFCKEVCGADEELRREVKSLLAFDKTSGNFLDAPPDMLAAEMFAALEEQTSLVNQAIGHYRLKKLLGKGGMGEVSQRTRNSDAVSRSKSGSRKLPTMNLQRDE